MLLGGLSVGLALAATLAFWPSRVRRRPRTAGLAVLIAVFAIPASAVAPARPLLLGLALLALVAAWLWLPGLRRRDAVAAGAMVAIAGAFAMAAGTILDADRSWIDYNDWQLAGAEGGASFEWNHDYGPLDWPRDGEALLELESDEPHYWRAAVLDEFDSTRWMQSGYSSGSRSRCRRRSRRAATRSIARRSTRTGSRRSASRSSRCAATT